MRLEHLNYFIALETYGSLNKVSQALYTTPQNVSRILKNLEDEMETDLFIRTPNGIIFTPSGKKMLDFAKSALEGLDEIKLFIHLQKEHANLQGEILLYSTNSANEAFLNDVIIKFQRTYPHIFINNIIVDWLEGYEQIDKNSSALGLLSHLPDQPSPTSLNITQMYQGQIVIVMHKDHPTANQSTLTIEQLNQEKLLILARNNAEKTELYSLFEPYIDSGQVKFSATGNLNAYYQLTATGQYICGAIQEGYAKQLIPDREQLVAIPLDGEAGQISYGLVMAKDKQVTQAEQYFIDFISNYCGVNEPIKNSD